MKRQKQNGMILFCTLVIMVILSIFLLVGVYRAQSSIMMTKRAMWEIKSYWAAKAGNTLAGDGCIRTVQWPDQQLLPNAGGYAIRLTPDRNCIIGEDENCRSSFNIYYINRLNGGRYTALHSNSASVEATLRRNFDRVNSSLPNNEFYALTAGKSGAYTCGLELIYNIYSPPYLFSDTTINQENIQAIQASSASACIYVANSIFASLSGTFSVDADGNTRPAMVVGGNVTILGNGGDPSPYGDGPLNMNEGSIFAPYVKLNNTEIKPNNTNTNLVKYGINVYNNFNVEGLETPTYNYNEPRASVPSGTFCLIQMPKYVEGDYQKLEYQSAVSSIINTYLSPRDFWYIYGESVANVIDEKNWNQNDLQTNGDIIDNNANLKLFPCYVGCNSVFNEEYDKLKGYDSFESIISGQQLQDQIDHDNLSLIGKILDKVDELTGSKITNEDIANFVEKLYKAYLRNAVNQFVKTYRSSDDKYEAFFVPDGNGISDTLYSKDLDVDYKEFTQARVLGVLGEYVGDISTMGSVPGAPSNLSEIVGGAHYGADMNVFKYLGVPDLSECFAKGDELDYIRTNYHNFLNNNPNSYIADKVKLSSGDMYLLDKITQHENREILTGFNNATNRISFDTSSLQFQLKGNLNSDGFFNYGAFKRDGNRYSLETKDNLGVKLNGHTLSVPDDIDIKGYVYGGGSINSGKSIYFEASGTNMMNGEQDISLIAQNDIRIRRNEGANGQGIRIHGVIWSENGNISIYPGSNEDVSIRGSLICKNGALTLTNVRNFSIIYDPDKARIIAQNENAIPWWEYITASGEETGSWNVNSELLADAIENGTGVVNVGTFKLFNRI